MKNSSINKILDDSVLKELCTCLKSIGFNLKKSDSKLTLVKNGMSFVVWLYRRDYRFIWDENLGEAYICFNIFFHLKFSSYNDWFFERFKKDANTEKFLIKDFLYFKLDKSLYNETDFSEKSGTPVIIENDFEKDGIHQYEPTTHILFNPNYIEIIVKRSQILNEKPDLSFIRNRKGLPIDYVCLPLYYENSQLALELFNKHYKFRIEYIENKIEKGQSTEQINKYSDNLDKFISDAKEMINKEYKNPFK